MRFKLDENFGRRTVDRFIARGHEVRLYAGNTEPGEGDLFDDFRARGLDVVRVAGLRRRVSLRDLLLVRVLRRELRAFAPDVVHTHASKAGALPIALVDPAVRSSRSRSVSRPRIAAASTSRSAASGSPASRRPTSSRRVRGSGNAS